MVGGAADPSSTLAALNSLWRGARLVLMGSITVDLPVSYMQLNDQQPGDNREFHAPGRRSGALEVTAITPKVLPSTNLPAAMEAAVSADSLECVVMKS
jgi:alcohol dehydrogenase